MITRKPEAMEAIYERAYVALELAWGDNPCPDGCKKPARTHHINIARKTDGTIAADPICRYGKDGKLLEIWRKAAGADKAALRETFGQIVIDGHGQRLEEFIRECKTRVQTANDFSLETQARIESIEEELRETAEKLGIMTSCRGRPYGAFHLLKQIASTATHLRKRAEDDQKSALEHYNRNQELARKCEDLKAITLLNAQKDEEIARLRARLAQKEAANPAPPKPGAKPKLRVVGTPPPIPQAATDNR